MLQDKDKIFSIGKEDLEWSTFRGSGPGGQHKNKTDSAVRLRHAPSNTTVISQGDRCQLTNKKQALKQLANHPKFKAWCFRRMKELSEGITLEEKIEAITQPQYLKIECKNEENEWIELNS